jgi:hypothetical protein
MELGGFEPPTSWVRSRLAVSTVQFFKPSICREKTKHSSFLFRPDYDGYAPIYVDTHVDIRRFGHESPLVPNPGEVRFELSTGGRRRLIRSRWRHSGHGTRSAASPRSGS